MQEGPREFRYTDHSSGGAVAQLYKLPVKWYFFECRVKTNLDFNVKLQGFLFFFYPTSRNTYNGRENTEVSEQLFTIALKIPQQKIWKKFSHIW